MQTKQMKCEIFRQDGMWWVIEHRPQIVESMRRKSGHSHPEAFTEDTVTVPLRIPDTIPSELATILVALKGGVEPSEIRVLGDKVSDIVKN